MPFLQMIGIASSASKKSSSLYPFFRRRLLSSTCTVDVIEGSSTQTIIIPPLIRLEAARLQYPSIITGNDFDHGLNDDINEIVSYRSILDSFDLNIFPNLECGSGGGGHVVLGKNGSGKTLLSQTLINSYNNQNNAEHQSSLHSGSIEINKTRDFSINRNHRWLTHVSFESHSELLLNENSTTVHRALIPGGGNRLSPTAKFLVVRLGMYPLLPRFINTLSTGEIRRVLLVRALVSKPELLLLDNAFDGLDVHGRKGLMDIIERVLKGFRMDILVQGVGDAKDTARTQIMLFSHRPEEISNGMGVVTYLGTGNDSISTQTRSGRSASELIKPLIASSSSSEIPSRAEILHFWQQGKVDKTSNDDILVEAKNLHVTRDDTILLSDLDWVVQRGERWHLGGQNGAGKSSLSRLLLRISMDKHSEWICNTSGRDVTVEGGQLNVTPSSYHTKRGGVALVSTELHLHAAQNWSNRTILEVLTLGASFIFGADRSSQALSHNNNNALVDIHLVTTAAKWLGLVKKDHHNIDDSILHRRFSTVSQGEQKLLLIASALALRPSLLVLDEPCQGLDIANRKLVLDLVEEICQTTDMSLIYITHHNEELIASIDRRLSLEDGKVIYCGAIL